MARTISKEKAKGFWGICMQGAFGSGVIRYRCSCCGGVSPSEKKVCPHCGAAMGAKATG